MKNDKNPNKRIIGFVVPEENKRDKNEEYAPRSSATDGLGSRSGHGPRSKSPLDDAMKRRPSFDTLLKQDQAYLQDEENLFNDEGELEMQHEVYHGSIGYRENHDIEDLPPLAEDGMEQYFDEHVGAESFPDNINQRKYMMQKPEDEKVKRSYSSKLEEELDFKLQDASSFQMEDEGAHSYPMHGMPSIPMGRQVLNEPFYFQKPSESQEGNAIQPQPSLPRVKGGNVEGRVKKLLEEHAIQVKNQEDEHEFGDEVFSPTMPPRWKGLAGQRAVEKEAFDQDHMIQEEMRKEKKERYEEKALDEVVPVDFEVPENRLETNKNKNKKDQPQRQAPVFDGRGRDVQRDNPGIPPLPPMAAVRSLHTDVGSDVNAAPDPDMPPLASLPPILFLQGRGEGEVPVLPFVGPARLAQPDAKLLDREPNMPPLAFGPPPHEIPVPMLNLDPLREREENKDPVIRFLRPLDAVMRFLRPLDAPRVPPLRLLEPGEGNKMMPGPERAPMLYRPVLEHEESKKIFKLGALRRQKEAEEKEKLFKLQEEFLKALEARRGGNSGSKRTQGKIYLYNEETNQPRSEKVNWHLSREEGRSWVKAIQAKKQQIDKDAKRRLGHNTEGNLGKGF